MKKTILLAVACCVASLAVAQKPLRFIKLDPKSTPTSHVNMVTTITDRPLRQFPTEIKLSDQKAAWQKTKIEMIRVDPKSQRLVYVEPTPFADEDQTTCDRYPKLKMFRQVPKK